MPVSYTHLDVYKRQGVLLPNVSLTSLTSSLPIVNPANSLMVYNTNINIGKGFYFWKGGKWNPIIDSSNIYKYLGTVSYTHLDVYKRQF